MSAFTGIGNSRQGKLLLLAVVACGDKMSLAARNTLLRLSR